MTFYLNHKSLDIGKNFFDCLLHFNGIMDAFNVPLGLKLKISLLIEKPRRNKLGCVTFMWQTGLSISQRHHGFNLMVLTKNGNISSTCNIYLLQMEVQVTLPWKGGNRETESSSSG